MNTHLGKRRRNETKRQRSEEEAEGAEETRTPYLSSQAISFRHPVALSIHPGSSAEPSPDRDRAETGDKDDKEANFSEKRQPKFDPAIHGCRSLSAYEKEGSAPLGKGTFGEVWKARDSQTGKLVAIKRFGTIEDPQGQGVDPNFLREISIMATLNHPNIVRMIEVLTPPLPSYSTKRRRKTQAVVPPLYKASIVMECLDTDLQRVIARARRQGRVFLRSEIKHLMRQILSAVAHLHASGVVHRDIKPSNLLYSNDGTLKLCDFGISRRLSSSDRRHKDKHAVCKEPIHGTVWYQAPELLPRRQEFTQAVDLWAVGCTFAELVVLRPLFPGSSRLKQLQLIDQLVPRRSGIFLRSAFDEQMLSTSSNHCERRQLGAMAAPSLSTMQCLGQATPMGDVGFELLASMLRREPAQRIDADTALRHTWFRNGPLPQLAKDLAQGINAKLNHR